MFNIECPWCGKRSQTEFSCGGEAHRTYPENSMDLTDEQWKDYLFIHHNPKGVFYEQWCHSHGCRRWFNVARNTITNEILAVYHIGQPKPELDHTQSES